MIIKASYCNTILIDKSEFITYLKPVFNLEEVNLFLNEIRKKHYDATHNCYAYILGDQMEIQKCSDDGEPSKTAGFPILEVLKKNGITNVICIVTRYFGGIKLGSGGLIRAYGSSCSECLKLAKFQEKKVISILKITIPYNLIGIVERYIRENTLLISTDFNNDVNYIVSLLKDKKDTFKLDLTNLTKGQITINEKAEKYEYFDI